MEREATTQDMILAAIQDVQVTVQATNDRLGRMEDRLTREVAGLTNEQHRIERQMIRLESTAAVRDELVKVLREDTAAKPTREEIAMQYPDRDALFTTFPTRDDLRREYPTREELHAAATSRNRFVIPLVAGMLIGAPGYITILMAALK